MKENHVGIKNIEKKLMMDRLKCAIKEIEYSIYYLNIIHLKCLNLVNIIYLKKIIKPFSFDAVKNFELKVCHLSNR